MKREVKIGNELLTINVYRAYTDKEAAKMFNVELQDIYDAVENNLTRFAKGLVCKCTEAEPDGVKMLFPEKGLCMLATFLKTEQAKERVLNMIEAYVGVKGFVDDLGRALIEREEERNKAEEGMGDEKENEEGNKCEDGREVKDGEDDGDDGDGDSGEEKEENPDRNSLDKRRKPASKAKRSSSEKEEDIR